MFGNIGLDGIRASATPVYPTKKSSISGSFTSLMAAENTTSPTNLVMHYQTSDGKEGVLHYGKDILVSLGGEGGTINAKYHESSTNEDPVAFIWGTDSIGRDYEKIVHLNDIDPNYATPAEMMVLNSHLIKLGMKDPASPIALMVSGSFDVDTKMDYEQYYQNYIAMQQLGGNKSNAALYQLQLERFLFFHQQNEGTNMI